MNKLEMCAEQIADEVDCLRNCEGQIGDIDLEKIKKYAAIKLVEYARSVINIETNPLIELPLSDYIRLESAWDKKHKEMFDRIDKDLLYIKEK